MFLISFVEVFLTHSVTRLDEAIHLKSGCIPTKGLCCPYRTGLYAFVILSGVVKGVEVSASRVSAFWARAGLSRALVVLHFHCCGFLLEGFRHGEAVPFVPVHES